MRSRSPGTPNDGLPERLAAARPAGTTYADVVVIGSGIAGLTAALRIREVSPGAARSWWSPRTSSSAGSTQWAQGGIAAALGAGDTPEQHEQDTLVAGAGACDEEAVRVLVTEGPEAVRELIALGTNFDHTSDGELSLTREGGHHRDRIAHAGGDATGAEIQRALVAAVQPRRRSRSSSTRSPSTCSSGDDGGVAGVTLHVMGEGQRDGVGAVHVPGGRARRPAASARCSPRPRTPRCRPATAWRWRCGPARCCATWSSCSSTRP